MITALETPATPTQLATERNPLFDAAFIAHTIATLTADYWQTCRVCGARRGERCRDGGRFARTHEGGAAA